jgi:hypothetical protein
MFVQAIPCLLSLSVSPPPRPLQTVGHDAFKASDVAIRKYLTPIYESLLASIDYRDALRQFIDLLGGVSIVDVSVQTRRNKKYVNCVFLFFSFVCLFCFFPLAFLCPLQ